MDIAQLLELRAQPTPRYAQNDRPVRLGIIGCGYVTEQSHLPAAAKVPAIDVVALADVRQRRAEELAAQFGVKHCVSDYRDLFGRVDAVIVALPHHLHAAVAVEFLGQGVHVLCEKPMAVSTDECRTMVTAAQASGAKLAVGHMRRFYDNMRLAKRLIETHFLGMVQRFEAEESVPFERFPASPFTVQPPFGGVLWDTGPHTLDLLGWWFGDAVELRYWDDAVGGVEANGRIEMVTAAGVPGVVELSRTRQLKNCIRVTCERGTLEIPTLNPAHLTIDDLSLSAPVGLSSIAPPSEDGAATPFFARQLADFASAILEDGEPLTSGAEGMRAIAMIERCRRVRQPLAVTPWMALQESVMQRVAACSQR